MFHPILQTENQRGDATILDDFSTGCRRVIPQPADHWKWRSTNLAGENNRDSFIL